MDAAIEEGTYRGALRELLINFGYAALYTSLLMVAHDNERAARLVQLSRAVKRSAGTFIRFQEENGRWVTIMSAFMKR